jgi:AraC-like DNA-binding protein
LDVERLRRACDYINDHAHQEITRNAVAEVVHMSVSGFSRFFKSHTGMTFQEFVADVRISRACLLLVTSDLPITDISLECGFADLSTFNRTFKRFRDSTPSQYRLIATNVISPE